MKTRNGFVSNSSSSSFIIAYKKADKTPCPTCGRYDVDDFVELVRKSEGDGDSSVNAEDLKEVLERLEESLEWTSDERKGEIRKVEKEVKKLVKEGWKVADISISYHNDTLNELLHSSQNIKILQGEEA
jgi:uncharacterized Zn finger protein (UPF0148 family)